jgi:hypothetical protein
MSVHRGRCETSGLGEQTLHFADRFGFGRALVPSRGGETLNGLDLTATQPCQKMARSLEA